MNGTSMYVDDNSMPSNVILAGVASAPSWFATFTDPSLMGVLGSVFLSIVLMFLGKLMDLGIRVYLEARGDKKNKHSDGNNGSNS